MTSIPKSSKSADSYLMGIHSYSVDTRYKDAKSRVRRIDRTNSRRASRHASESATERCRSGATSLRYTDTIKAQARGGTHASTRTTVCLVGLNRNLAAVSVGTVAVPIVRFALQNPTAPVDTNRRRVRRRASVAGAVWEVRLGVRRFDGIEDRFAIE